MTPAGLGSGVLIVALCVPSGPARGGICKKALISSGLLWNKTSVIERLVKPPRIFHGELAIPARMLCSYANGSIIFSLPLFQAALWQG